MPALQQVALAHPHLRGYGFDLPEVKPVFEEYIESFSLQDRVSFVGGSFFEEELPKADVIIMGHILHDWGMSDKRMLIRKAYDALSEVCVCVCPSLSVCLSLCVDMWVDGCGWVDGCACVCG